MVVDVLGPSQEMSKLVDASSNGVLERRGAIAGGGISPLVVRAIRSITRPMAQQT